MCFPLFRQSGDHPPQRVGRQPRYTLIILLPLVHPGACASGRGASGRYSHKVSIYLYIYASLFYFALSCIVYDCSNQCMILFIWYAVGFPLLYIIRYNLIAPRAIMPRKSQAFLIESVFLDSIMRCIYSGIREQSGKIRKSPEHAEKVRNVIKCPFGASGRACGLAVHLGLWGQGIRGRLRGYSAGLIMSGRRGQAIHLCRFPEHGPDPAKVGAWSRHNVATCFWSSVFRPAVVFRGRVPAVAAAPADHLTAP